MTLQRIVLILFSIVPAFGLCQESNSWDLNECINYALQNNLDIKSYEISEKTAKINTSQSKLNLLPSVSASSDLGFSFGQQVDIDSKGDIFTINTQSMSNSYRLSSSLNLFDGFAKINRIAYAKYRHEAAKWRIINSQDDLAFNVLFSFYEVIYYQGLAEIAKEQLELSGYNLKKTGKQIEAGLIAKTDLLEMQATYEKEKLDLIQAENRLAEAKLTLSQQMNLNLPKLDSLIVDSEKSSPVANPLPSGDSLFLAFTDLSPYIKIAEAELDAAQKQEAINRGMYFPTIRINASVNTRYSENNKQDGEVIPFRDQFDNNMSQYVGASISIPIFSKNQVRNNVQQAKLDKERAQVDLDNYRQTLFYEMSNNLREQQSLYREFIQTKKQLEADNLSYRAAQRKYDEGLIDVIDLLTVKNRIASSKSQLLWSRLQWEIKNKTLSFYKGVRFWEM